MSDPAVIDWDRIIHKNVRSKDMQGAGNVVAIDGDSVIISTQGAQHQYKIPKSHVEGYNGAEVFLDIAVSDMSSFNTDNDDNIKAQTNSKEAGTLSNTESSVLPVKITKTSSQTRMIQGQEVQSKKEEGKEASEVSREGGPVKSEVTVRPTQSITTTANKTSTLPSKPTTQTQSKNNMPAPPPSSSSLTTKTLAEPPEKILSEEAEEA